MGIADDVKNLGEDIVASYNARVKAIGAIVNDTRKTLKGFHAEHQEMSAKQAKDLTDFVNDLAKKVAAMLKGFKSSHKEMTETLKKNLSDFVKDLAKDVGAMMGAITKAHKEMADNLKESLEKGETARLKDFKAMMGNIQKGNKDIENYVAKKLKEFSEAHAEMSDELKKDLAKYVAGIVKGTQELLGGFHGEREKMAAHWQAMAAVMAKKRGVEPVEVEAGAEVKTVEEAVVKPAARKGRPKGKGKKK